MQKLSIISKAHDVLKEKDMNIAGIAAKIGEYKQYYTVEVSERITDGADRGSDKAKIITNYKGGTIFVGVKDGMVFLFHMIFEYQYNAQYMGMFNGLISTLKFE
jgi:hypothetical protein